MPTSLPDVYSSAHFALHLDGSQVLATLRSIDGGSVKTEVVNYHSGDHGQIWRQLAKPKYEDIKIVASLASGGMFWSWLEQFVKGQGTRKTGALIAADYDYKEKAKRNFVDALIAAIDFPKFDANDKNPANLTVTISPEKITYEKGSGAKLDERAGDETSQQHVMACNFEFKFDGVPTDTTARVSKVDAFSLKTKIIDYHYGGRLEPSKQAGKLEYPNLVFYLPEVDAEPFRKLHMKTVKGDRAPASNAQLTFHNNAKTVKGTFTFENCHIFNVSPEKHDAASEDIRLQKVECAIEGLKVSISGS